MKALLQQERNNICYMDINIQTPTNNHNLHPAMQEIV